MTNAIRWLIALLLLLRAQGIYALPSGGAEAGPAAPARHIILDVVARTPNADHRAGLIDGTEYSVLCPEFVWQKIVVSVEGRGALGQFIRCNRGPGATNKLLIWVHGGPWAAAGVELGLEQLVFLEAGYDIFVPLYPGSSDRPTVIDRGILMPDIVDALAELRVALNWARGNYDLVEVAGESFGSYLAPSLAPALREGESLYLMSPSLGGKPFLLQVYARTGEELQILFAGDTLLPAEATSITEAYFRRLENYEPAALLSGLENLNLKLIYGGADDLMVREDIELLRRLAVPGCGVDYRPDRGHHFGDSQAHLDAVRRLIRCGRETPSAASPGKRGR